ncbi:MAG: hypothetical protein J5J00_04250 [Deltaproteobacteria bacterium]|nr:hypothetical protein [Deltaproteobacteria bacterium]
MILELSRAARFDDLGALSRLHRGLSRVAGEIIGSIIPISSLHAYRPSRAEELEAFAPWYSFSFANFARAEIGMGQLSCRTSAAINAARILEALRLIGEIKLCAPPEKIPAYYSCFVIDAPNTVYHRAHFAAAVSDIEAVPCGESSKLHCGAVELPLIATLGHGAFAASSKTIPIQTLSFSTGASRIIISLPLEIKQRRLIMAIESVETVPTAEPLVELQLVLGRIRIPASHLSALSPGTRIEMDLNEVLECDLMVCGTTWAKVKARILPDTLQVELVRLAGATI